MNKGTRYALLGLLLFLLVAGIGGYYYYAHYYLPTKIATLTAMSIQQSQPARDSFNTGDYTTSINNLQTLITQAPTSAERARLQLLLASDLLYRDQGNDFSQSISLFKQIINNFAAAPVTRAISLNNIAKIVLAQNSTFYKDNFTDAPLSTYLPASGSDSDKVEAAYLKILQLSDETYPNSQAEYSIAGNYYAPLIQNNEVAATNLQTTATLMQKYVTEGDSRNDQQLYSPGGLVFNQLYRADALSVSGAILDTPSVQVREDAFKTGLALSDGYEKTQYSESPTVIGGDLKIRFDYSNFLMQNFTSTRDADIQTLLIPFGSIASSSAAITFLGSLGTLTTNPSGAYVNMVAYKLADISSDFKTFLSTIGVNLP